MTIWKRLLSIFSHRSAESALDELVPAGLKPSPGEVGTQVSDEEVLALTQARIDALVWGGFEKKSEIFEHIVEAWDWEHDLDRDWLRARIGEQMRRKRDAERQWPATTDNDRLAMAFVALTGRGVIALHNAGYTMQDGLCDVSQALHDAEIDAPEFVGWCFYHQQDVEAVLETQRLYLAFGAFDGEAAQSLAVAEIVQRSLREAGLQTQWSGDIDTRLAIEPFHWQRRGNA
ncbi:MAG: hypothetical protein JF591_00930 [Lysobacter sp.]|nr:hypothetical protein [Lysobacter sp.]